MNEMLSMILSPNHEACGSRIQATKEIKPGTHCSEWEKLVADCEDDRVFECDSTGGDTVAPGTGIKHQYSASRL